MRRCLDCGATYPTATILCSICGAQPATMCGFAAYAPDLAYESGGFKEEYFGNLVRLESENFWFRSRNRLIAWALRKYIPQFQSFLEIGCGTGYVLSGLVQEFPAATFCGSEVYIEGLMYAASRNPGVRCMQMDARRVPFCEEFDALGAFDVLEHIEQDELVLRQTFDALKPGGVLILTVPQHPWLWSPVDEYSCHKRRYARGELEAKLQSAGFSIIRTTSFTSFLLPAIIISRLLQRLDSGKHINPEDELHIPAWMNVLFERIMGAEIASIRAGVDFPAGGSRLIVSRKG